MRSHATYSFTGFSGDLTGAAMPQTIAMTAPRTVKATFAAPLSPALSIAKAHTGNFTQGQNGAIYTVTVSNQAGAGPTSGTVTVTETVPAGMSLMCRWRGTDGHVRGRQPTTLRGATRWPAGEAICQSQLW